MYNQQLHSRAHHPHLYGPQDSEKKSSRSKIELTHIQQNSRGQDRSNYTANTINTHPIKSQYHPQSTRKERSFSLQEPAGHLHINKHLYLLMKEQIDISAVNFREKMNFALKGQAQEIQKLTSVIAYNAKLIQKQQEIIKKLHCKEQNMTNTVRSRASGKEESRTPSKSPAKISLTQRKSVQKLLASRRDVSPVKGQSQYGQAISSKLNALIGIVDDMDKKLYEYAIKNREMINRIREIQKKVTNEIWRKIRNSEQFIKAYLEVNQQKINKVQHEIDSKSLEVKNFYSKFQHLTEETQEIKSLMFNLANREFNYDSYQVNILRENLNRISQKVNALAGQHFFQERQKKSDKHQENFKGRNLPHGLAHSYSMLNKKNGDPFQNFERSYSELEKSQLSSFSQYKPNHYSEIEDRVRQSQEWNCEENSVHMSDQDEFYFEESEAEKEEREKKLKKLQQILKRSGYAFPVRVQIDGTGYLKESSTGIYILDELDNGFELIPEELQILKTNGIIIM